MAKSLQNMAMLQLVVILSSLSGVMCHDYETVDEEERIDFPGSSEKEGLEDLFYHDGSGKTVLTKWDQLPKDLRDHIPENSYEILTPESHFHSPFLYIYSELEYPFYQQDKTWVFIFLHGFAPPKLKMKRRKLSGLRVLMTNILSAVSENGKGHIRSILLSPMYFKESRKGFSQMLAVVIKILTAFFKMLEKDSTTEYSLFFIGHSMGGVVIRFLMEQNKKLSLKEVQRYMFHHEKFNVESVVTIASPHCGVRITYYRILAFLGLNIVNELVITDKKQRLLTLAFNEFQRSSYIPQLGNRVVYYAIRGDKVVQEESALGLLESPPSKAVLSKSDSYKSCRQLSRYGPHFPYTISKPPNVRNIDKNSAMFERVQVFLSSSGPQRFLVDLTSRQNLRKLHQLAKGSELQVAENFTLYYRHVASKVVRPLKVVELATCSD